MEWGEISWVNSCYFYVAELLAIAYELCNDLGSVLFLLIKQLFDTIDSWLEMNILNG